jgi:putative hydrolase of the HAD superfamily
MITTLLFDVDGVLVNGQKFSEQLAKDYGITSDKTASFFNGDFKKCVVGECDLKEALAPHLSSWGWTKSVDELLEYWFSTEHQVDEELVMYIQELRAKGMKCYVATNQEKYRVKYMLEKMGFADSFDGVFASAHLGHKKPAHEFFEKMLQQIKVGNKSEVLFWDDTPANIQAAKEFGIHAEFYSNFEIFKKKMVGYLTQLP